uniref:Putative maltose O-acetyltransferase n=1 Tax=Weissella thailandensis fsh4-2 TaxID=1056112 RepID=G0UHN5_9LACO|nr:putative maltose O-acetyltransferase [Weissella thailandensis fsh4-2]
MPKKLDEPDVEALAKKPIFEKVADGDWYQYGKEPQLQAIVKSSTQTIQKLNKIAVDDFDEALKQLHELAPHMADDVEVYFPITNIEYPNNLFIDEGTFINLNFTILSAGKITIGKNCFLVPNTQLYTPNHHPNKKEMRREGWQYDLPITIGDDCWFGGSVIVLPGVEIGDNVVVGAGSVVTHDIPSNTVVAGNPAHIIRHV